MNISYLLSISGSLYNPEYLAPFSTLAFFSIFIILQMQKSKYCKLWHKQYWVNTEIKGSADVKEMIVCKKCSHHFMK